MYKDLEEEFKEEFGVVRWDALDLLLDKVVHNDFEDIEENGFDITCSKEKVNQLQENVCLDICFGENEIQLLYENGIDNGTELNEYSFNSSTNLSDIDRHYEIITDVVVDYERMDNLGVKYSKQKAEIMLNNNKSELLLLAKNQNYDNYVTGGGTTKTDRYYELKREELNSKGLYWEYVTKTETVKADFS